MFWEKLNFSSWEVLKLIKVFLFPFSLLTDAFFFFFSTIQVLIYQIYSRKLLRNFQLNYIWSVLLYLIFSFSVFTFIESFLLFLILWKSTCAFNLFDCLFYRTLSFVNVFKKWISFRHSKSRINKVPNKNILTAKIIVLQEHEKLNNSEVHKQCWHNIVYIGYYW